MRAALRGMDVVGKGVDVLLIGVVVLESDLHRGPLDDALHVDGVREKDLFVFIEIADKFDDAALVMVDTLNGGLHALIGQGDAHALVEKRHLAQPGLENIKLKIARFKYAVGIVLTARIGPELHGGAGAVGGADHLQVIEHLAARVFLLVDVSVLVHGHLHMAAEGVDHAGTHAMQAAGYLVALASELAARMQHRQAYFHRGTAQLGVNPHRKAAAVVAHFATAVLVQKNVDIGAVAGQRLVDGVVHDFIHAVMQAAKIRGANVHAGTLAHCLQTFEHLDLRFIIRVFIHGGRAGRGGVRLGLIVGQIGIARLVVIDFRSLIGHQIPLPLARAAPDASAMADMENRLAPAQSMRRYPYPYYTIFFAV